MNKAILVGRLTRDPELRTTPNGVNVCSFTVAVDRRFVRTGEERQADFINCVAWRQTAEFICRYFSKGRMIGIVGSIQTRTWDDKEGKRQYATEVQVDEAYFTESKSSAQGGGSGQQRSQQWGDSPMNQTPPQSFGSQETGLPDGGDFMPGESDDDLPF